MLRIPDVYPGSRIWIFSIPDPESASKNLSILTPKNWKHDPGCSSRIRILIFYPSQIPDPGVKKALDPGSHIRICNTGQEDQETRDKRLGSRDVKLYIGYSVFYIWEKAGRKSFWKRWKFNSIFYFRCSGKTRRKWSPALKREHPALQNIKFLNFFLFLWVIFVLLDPDPDSESGSTELTGSRSNPDPDPKPYPPISMCLAMLSMKSPLGTNATTDNSDIRLLVFSRSQFLQKIKDKENVNRNLCYKKKNNCKFEESCHF